MPIAGLLLVTTHSVSNLNIITYYKLLLPNITLQIGSQSPSQTWQYRYAILYHERAFYVFGGGTGHYVSTIARLDVETTTWTKSGDMVAIRRDHSVIFDGEKFLVVGGVTDNISTPIKNEVCTFSDTTTITCTQQSTVLVDYKLYPELILVPDSYGKGKENCYY